MGLPNFLIIGSPKSGTTSLYRYLCQHPQIFMSSLKEPHFFAYEGKQPDFRGPGDSRAGTNLNSVVDFAAYQALFEPGLGAQAAGEASTMYLYWPGTAARIHARIPAVKLIAILRHPLERAYSHYLHLRNDGREWLEFPAALEAEAARIGQHYAPAWHYASVGRYSQQLRSFLEYFPRQQLRIYLYEEFARSPQAVLRDMHRFLGVDAHFQPDVSKRHNASRTVRRHRWLHEFLAYENLPKSMVRHRLPSGMWRWLSTYLYKRNVKAAPSLSPDLRRMLLPSFRSSILELQSLLQRDLSEWLV